MTTVAKEGTERQKLKAVTDGIVEACKQHATGKGQVDESKLKETVRNLVQEACAIGAGEK